MDRDWERYERRGFGGREDDDEFRRGDERARNRVTRRDAWSGSAVPGRFQGDVEDERRFGAPEAAGGEVWRGAQEERGRYEYGPSRWGGEYWREDVEPGRQQWERGDRVRHASYPGAAEAYGRRFGGAWDRDRWEREQPFTRGRGYGWGRADDEARFTDRSVEWGAGQRMGPAGWSPRTEAWYTPGPYAGRGPRGWRRNDERIYEDVCELLTWHGEIDASEIEIDVRNGEVTLRGVVENRRAKRLAEDLVEDVRGVRDVHNQLRVREDRMTRWGAEAGATTTRTTTAAAYGTTTGTLTGGRTGMVPNIAPEMTVVGADGDEVGVVKEVRGSDFLVDRAMQRDVYVPVSAVRSYDGTTVRLTIPAGEIDNQGWENPPIVEGSTDTGTATRAT